MKDAGKTSVGIREFKANLSAHLRRAESGQRLTITDRGRAIATLEPIERREPAAWLKQLSAEGRVRLGSAGPVGTSPRVRLKGGESASAAIIEDRR